MLCEKPLTMTIEEATELVRLLRPKDPYARSTTATLVTASYAT